MQGYKPTYILPDRYLINKDVDVFSVRSKRHIAKRLDKYGYPRVNLYEGTKNKTVSIHRLIAKAFIDNPHNLPEVNHIDGDKTNYKVDNLEWVSSSENQKHAFDSGLQVAKTGERNPAAKYSEEDVITVCQLLKSGIKNSEIRDLTNFSMSFIEKIKYGECWTYLSKNYGILPKAKRATTSREA